ncbi:MAG: VWA domain-containing protein [Thermoanaerobaculia bacterium]
MKRTSATLLMLLPALALAQTATTQPPMPFQEAVEVRVMDLDVAVTDSRGRPIPDLTREDFTVRVDGKVVPIDYFVRVDEGTIHAPDLAQASPDRVLEEFRRGGEAYVPRHFLIYVDVGHMSLAARQRAVEGLRDLVTRMGPSDTGRIVLFDRRSKELTPWTASKETLLAGLTRVEESGVGMSRLLTERQTMRDIDSVPAFRRSTRQTFARSYAEQERAEVRRMLEDLEAEVATLAPMPGKKALLHVSGGFELQPGYAMMAYASGSFGLSSLSVTNVSRELTELVRRANASEITFYTVDARGLTAEGISAAEDDPLASRPGIAFLAREDSQAGLQTMARETGGIALLNSNELSAGLARVYQDSSTYYSIGVNLSKLEGVAYRDVRVDVRRPGLTVRTRRGYAPRTSEERARDSALAALRTNMEYRAFPVSLRTAPPTKQKRLLVLPVQVTFPASALTFLPGEEVSRAQAEMFIGMMDDRGRMSEISRDEASFTLPKGAPADSPLTYTANLQTRKGSYRLVINVRDKATGRMGTGKADVRVD